MESRQKDVVLTVIQELPLDRLPPHDVWSAYRTAVYKTQNSAYADASGAVSDVLAAGQIVAPHLMPMSESGVFFRNHRTFLTTRFPRESKSLEWRMDKLISSLPQESLLARDDEQEEGRLGGRKGPELDTYQRELVEVYKARAKADGTFKLALYAAAANYEAVAASVGIDMAKFWNLHDSKKVLAALGQVSKVSALRDIVDRVCKQKFNRPLASFTARQFEIVTDEFVSAMQNEIHVLTESAHMQFRTQLDSMRRHVMSVSNHSESAKRRCVDQWKDFFTKYGKPDMVPSSFDELRGSVTNGAVISFLETHYDLSQAKKRGVVQRLRRLFPDVQIPREYKLMSRVENDLYLGDQTGDCTAWHLETGMNAWTVPIWNSHPGFNQFMIMEGKTLVAKMGMFIAVEGKTPVLLIDSLEIGKQVTDSVRTKSKIIAGLTYLRSWAFRQGFKRIDINNFSNSGEVFTELLLPYIKDTDDTPRLRVLSGLRPITEVRKHFGIDVPNEERIYIQTLNPEDDEGDMENPSEYLVLREFERTVNATIPCIEEDKRQVFRDALAQGKWPEVFTTILEARFPRIVSLFGSNWTEWKAFYRDVSHKDGRIFDIDDLEGHFKKFSMMSTKVLQPHWESIEEFVRYSIYDVLNQVPHARETIRGETIKTEAYALDLFLDAVTAAEDFHEFSPEVAIKRLYGARIVATDDDMPLMGGIPTLVLPS